MAHGKRSRLLLDAVDLMLREDFCDRILPFDSAAAEHYARIGAERKAEGRPISQFDCQIAGAIRQASTRSRTPVHCCSPYRTTSTLLPRSSSRDK
jgi:predicted nucleic acid-binding protein